MYSVEVKFLLFSLQIEQKVPSSSAGGSVVPPQLPVNAPNAQFGFGMPFSYNIPPGSDSMETGFDAAAKPLNTNLQVCNILHLEKLKEQGTGIVHSM
jgi:hypothetical protein